MSRFFQQIEFERSATAEKLGIRNTMDKHQSKHWETFACKVLDPIRAELGSPIIINSGFRSAELNKAVGGVKDSWHLGIDDKVAVDMVPQNQSIYTLYEVIRKLHRNNKIVFDKCLLENNTWIHLQYRVYGINKGIMIENYHS